MVTNFDSTEQNRAWRELTDKTNRDTQNPQSAPLPAIENLWLENRDCHVCKNLLNEHTSFTAYFAGILRTAYLYCPQIMLTDAEVCDGLFFLTLGPNTVNTLLGKSPKDGPSITISGRADTFEECLFNFTTTTFSNLKNAEAQENNANQYTLKPMEYSIFNRFVSEKEVSSQSQDFYIDFNSRIKAWKNGDAKLPEVLAHAFASFFGKDDDYFAFLAQRWQEWLDAVAYGQVCYKKQQGTQNKQSRASESGNKASENKPNYDSTFKKQAEMHANILEQYFRNKGSQCQEQKEQTHGDFDEFKMTLNMLKEEPKRSIAFNIIKKCALPKEITETSCLSPTKTLLTDWYQFVYQRSLAIHLNAYLVAVSAHENSYERIASQYLATSAKPTPHTCENQHKKNILSKIYTSLKRRFTATPSPSLMLSGSITSILGDMPYHVFSCFCYQSRSAIRAWRDCSPSMPARKQREYTQNMAYLVQQASEEHNLREDGKAIGFKTLLAAILALVSALCDKVWLSSGSFPVWLAVGAAWAISVVPDVRGWIQWGRSTRSSTKTVVFMEG